MPIHPFDDGIVGGEVVGWLRIRRDFPPGLASLNEVEIKEFLDLKYSLVSITVRYEGRKILTQPTTWPTCRAVAVCMGAQKRFPSTVVTFSRKPNHPA